MNTAKLSHHLANQIRGRVVVPGDAEFASVVQIDNGRVRLEPPIAVLPASVDDVIATVRFAREQGLRISTKCGGHSAAGYCLNNDGIVLDMRFLNDLSLNRETARLRVGMGARWKQVYDYIEVSQSGLLPVGGGCAGVGVAGFLLGGGYSFASRSYGLGIDNLLSLKIVTADGQLHQLGAGASGPLAADLFWACRGGGGNNFGIVVEGELQLQNPKAETFMMGQIQFPFYRIEEVLSFYNEWVEAKSFPKEMAIYGFLGMQPNPKAANQPILSLRFTPVYNGDFATGMDLLQPLMKLHPMASSFYAMTMPEWENFIGTGTVVNGRSAYIRSLMMPAKSMDARVAQVFMKHMARCPSPDTFMVWTHGGGQISTVADDATAFVHRQARFIPEIKSIWDFNRPQDMRKNVEWAYLFFEELGEFGNGAYLNYIDPLLADWPKKYYGTNYKKLQRIKNQCDKEKLFGFQQGVGSPFKPTTALPLDLSPLQNT